MCHAITVPLSNILLGYIGGHLIISLSQINRFCNIYYSNALFCRIKFRHTYAFQPGVFPSTSVLAANLHKLPEYCLLCLCNFFQWSNTCGHSFPHCHNTNNTLMEIFLWSLLLGGGRRLCTEACKTIKSLSLHLSLSLSLPLSLPFTPSLPLLLCSPLLSSLLLSGPDLGRLLVVLNLFRLRVMEASVLNAVFHPSSALCLETILCRGSTDSSLHLMAWFLLRHTPSTMRPHADRCAPFLIMSNYDTSCRQGCAFLNYVQWNQLDTGGLQLICRIISRTIERRGMHHGSTASGIPKGLNTNWDVSWVFYFLRNQQNTPKTCICLIIVEYWV